MTEHALPHSLEAERAVLGAVLCDRETIIAVASWLLPEHFYSEQHARIYAAMLDCYRRRTPPDLVTVTESLRAAGALDALGGPAALVDLASGCLTPVHAEYYARSVERYSLKRQIIGAAGQIAKLGYNGAEPDAILDQAEALLHAIEQRRPADGFVPISAVVDDLLAQLQKMQAGQVVGLPTGFRDLDELTGGLQKSDLIILAARPAVGKTSFALSLGLNAAKAGAAVGFYSLEMSREQLVQRLLATTTGLDTQKLRSGEIRDADMTTVMDALAALHELPISLNDTPGITLHDLRSRAIRLQAEQGLDLLIVDYLQLIRSPRGKENRVQEVSEISREMKSLARELDVPVIALSQLSRAVESRTSHVPMLSDLRESGSLEQDADLVWFIYREELYDDETDKKGTAEIHIAKHRNGPVGVVPLRFFSATTRFADLERYRQPVGY